MTPEQQLMTELTTRYNERKARLRTASWVYSALGLAFLGAGILWFAPLFLAGITITALAIWVWLQR